MSTTPDLSAISLPLVHRVSCVAARAPPEARVVFKEVYRYMYQCMLPMLSLCYGNHQ